ncbi:MAG: YdbL family protein [Parvularculaceae bacterium]
MLKKLALAAVASFAAANAFAASAAIEAAKDQCVVGERNDGYLGIVSGATASADLRREVSSINQQRKAAYARLAARNGVTIDDTARLTAERLISQAGSGECVQNASGAWVRV